MKSVVASFLLVSLSIVLPSHPAVAVDYLSCNGPVVQFETEGFNFGVEDAAGSGIKWGSIAQCGFAGNFTQGTGNAMCVKSGVNVANFDTSFRTNSFSLAGATAATLSFTINYQDFNGVAGNDRLDVDVQINGGAWTTKATYEVVDIGAANVVGSGQPRFINLAAHLGEDSVRVRFRYVDPGASPDNGVYVMIDNLALVCSGGADMQSSVQFDKATVLEGEDVSYTLTYRNGGPQNATEVTGIGTVPPGFSVLSILASQGTILPAGGFGSGAIGGSLGALGANAAATVAVNAKAGIFPELLLDVTSPAAVAGTYDVWGAMFGPRVQPSTPLSGGIAIANDGTGTTTDACEALVNAPEVAGKLVLVEKSSCAFDEQTKRVQDAGGLGAIIIGDAASVPPPYNTATFFLKYFNPLQVMRSSGLVGSPITIPAVLVSLETGTILKANVVNNVQVKLTGIEVLAQEQEVAAVGSAAEFDSDFPGGFAGLFLSESSNNFSSGKVTVLKDSDRDRTADILEECDLDAEKTAAGVCGCGRADADTDGSGVLDCRTGEELKVSIEKARQLIGQLRTLSASISKKKAQALKASQAAVKTNATGVLQRIAALVANPVQPVTTVGAPNLADLAGKVLSLGRKAVAAKGGSLSKRKKQALGALKKLRSSLA